MPFYRQAYLDGEGAALRHSHLSLGHHPRTDDELMISPTDRTMGVHLIGKAGSGKSSGMKNLVHQDALEHRAIIVIDPHCDLVDECIAELPQACVSHTYVLDMRDEESPFGCNALEVAGNLDTEEERTQAVERLLHIFDLLWEDVLKQQFLPMLLRCAVIAFLDNPGSTLVDMMEFFKTDEAGKGKAFRAHILKNVRDRTVRTFFQEEFDNLSEVEQRRRVQPLMNRLQGMFIGRSLVRNILGQRKNSVNWRKVIERHEHVFIKLPTTTMKEDARLLGAILMSQISAAGFSFADTPPAQRPGFSLYVDEVQNFATRDFERIVVEGRKFGIRLHVAHQNQGQLPDYLVRATGGMHTQVVFRITTEDAKAYAPSFPARPATEGEVNVNTAMCKYLLEDGIDSPHIREFVRVYLRPLQGHKSGGKVTIEGGQWDVDMKRVLLFGAKAGVGKREFYVDDPTPHLDNLFRDVMRQRDPLLDIPWDAIAGLSNCGRHFFNSVRFANSKSVELTRRVQFPTHLAHHTAGGYTWLREPRTSQEQFLHCIFHLRMVMMYLARNPVLKGGKAPSIDYTQILIQLPVRMALVKVGDEVGQIMTNDTPPPLKGEALEARRFFLREQTRQTYCHPRAQIEDLIDDTTPPDGAALSRWEEVEDSA